MYLYASLFTLCLMSAVAAALPAGVDLDDHLAFVSDFVESANAAGELILGEGQEDIWRRKCEANGGPEAFASSRRAGFELAQCVQKIVNVTELRREIADRRTTGDLDEVFPKYCDREDEFLQCFEAFVVKSQRCFEEKELKQRQVVHGIIQRVFKFVCAKDGNRIAMFIADKGPQCFKQNLQAINSCIKAAYGVGNITIPTSPLGKFNGLPELPQIKEVPSFAFEKKDCLKIDELQRCTVAALETCEEATPANFIEAVFNYIRKSTPCME